MALKASDIVGHPSEKDLKYLVSSQNIYDCPLTINDMNNAHAIFGPDIAGVRGPDRVLKYYVTVPYNFLELHKYATLVADVCFVKNVAFLVTMSRDIRFATVEFIRTRTAKQLIKSLKIAMKLYTRGSMQVKNILMDMELDKTVNELMDNVVANNYAAKEHVYQIE